MEPGSDQYLKAMEARIKFESDAIAFPVLSNSGDKLIESVRRDFVAVRVGGCDTNGLVRIKYQLNPRMCITWLIDRNGGFREVRTISYRRYWARRFLRFVDLVQAECEIVPPRQLTVGQLLTVLAPLKSPPSFRTASVLRRYLKNQPEDGVFDGPLFRAFWEKHLFQVKPEQWLEQYPSA